MHSFKGTAVQRKGFDYAKHGESYGVKVEGVSIDHKAVVERKNKVVKTLVSGIKAMMRANKVTVVEGEGRITERTP